MEIMKPLIIVSPLQCVLWMVVGGIAGALAHRFMPSRGSCLVKDIILGLLGVIVGGFVLKPSPSIFSPEIEFYVNHHVEQFENFLMLHLDLSFRLNPNVSTFLPFDFFGNLIVATFGACALIAVGRFVLRRHRPIE